LSLEFIEATLFTRLLPEYLTDDEYAQFQLYLANDPEAGDVIQGTGGFRKVRWGDPRGTRATRGLRVSLLKAAADEEKRQRAKRPPLRRK
jgi:hypothetical protein